ncbi:hypothetical protein NC652_016736 [Populus alba x Populus x berolinensis]|nr:hypothetical protein NC652_016736 [Populus alba x Populus x berolinensis]
MLSSIHNRRPMNGRDSGIVINPHCLICHQDTKTRTVHFINPGGSRAFGISGLQLQTASTDSFLALSGHGSPPKTSGATVTEHDCFPTQFCRSIMDKPVHVLRHSKIFQLKDELKRKSD